MSHRNLSLNNRKTHCTHIKNVMPLWDVQQALSGAVFDRASVNILHGCAKSCAPYGRASRRDRSAASASMSVTRLSAVMSDVFGLPGIGMFSKRRLNLPEAASTSI